MTGGQSLTALIGSVVAVTEEEVLDSPTGWVAKHIKRYEASDGANGTCTWASRACCSPPAGRRTGKLRRTALMYGEDAGRYLLVASNGGSATHPAWYLNLAANPDVEVQVRGERSPPGPARPPRTRRPSSGRSCRPPFPTYDKYLVTAATRAARSR